MLTIYHNPRCSKSRQTLALIEENNQDVTIIEYLKTALDEQTIRDLISYLGVTAIDMMRTKEDEFKQQNLKGADEDTLINALVNTPKLIERPIVVKADKAIIGRPPENVLTLID